MDMFPYGEDMFTRKVSVVISHDVIWPALATHRNAIISKVYATFHRQGVDGRDSAFGFIDHFPWRVFV